MDKIVDEHIKAIVKEARKKEKDINTQIEKLKKKLRKVEEVEESVINDEIVHLEKKKAELYGIPSKNGKVIPIKKVRLFTRYSSLLELKEHQQLSNKAHKRKYYVVNDGNYLMALYEGENRKGKVVRDFKIVNRLDASEYFKNSKNKSNDNGDNCIVPKKKQKDSHLLQLKHKLKIGKMVLLYEVFPEELKNKNSTFLNDRLYKVVGLGTNKVKRGEKYYYFGMVFLRHHQEAQSSSNLKFQDGKFKSSDGFISQRKMSHNQFYALIEGEDFTISPLGELEFKQ